jgi:hypothetical protein
MYQAKTMRGRAFVTGAHDEQTPLIPDPRTTFTWLPETGHGPDLRTAGPIPR